MRIQAWLEHLPFQDNITTTDAEYVPMEFLFSRLLAEDPRIWYLQISQVRDKLERRIAVDNFEALQTYLNLLT